VKNSIKIRRKEIKMSQEEIAAEVGVTRQTILAVENDKYDPSLNLAFLLAKALNTTVDELFEFEHKGGSLNDF
jgi:putative transcriptional regulator